MKTLSLPEAADFLKVHPEEVRRRAKQGAIPGAKVGRRWVFIEDDLAVYLRSLYRYDCLERAEGILNRPDFRGGCLV
ncbi:helix-turn-helix domain-containing protein [Metallibacterium sp.]|uniref:helix-turn-helix domain-containing protein n=1 Tax=Metallibacterium sp. TaxID=2940281 RepID=UPI00261DFFDD|nr:helix-turn-helix domain-containing protein [Metallibacterium sp.]